MTSIFAVLTGYLEGALVGRALAMASAAGLTLHDVALAIRADPSDSESAESAAEGGQPRPHPQQIPPVSGSNVPQSRDEAALMLSEAIVSKPRAGGQGLLWYQKNVILPVSERAGKELLLSTAPGEPYM